MQTGIKNFIRVTGLGFILFAGFTPSGLGQKQAMNLGRLLERSAANYPLLQAKMMAVKAAEEERSIIKNTLIPFLDAAYQINYATSNNLTGMLYTPYLVPISGPPSATNRMEGLFGSAAGLLSNWQPLRFGYRNAQYKTAEASVDEVKADADQQLFEHQAEVIRAWLRVQGTMELLKVYEQDLALRDTGLILIRNQVVSGLRPGVDTALSNADLSAARIALIQGLHQFQQAVLVLKKLVASEVDSFDLAYGQLFTELPLINHPEGSAEHPLTNLVRARLGLDLARKDLLTKSVRPILSVWGSLFARGSGLTADGEFKPLEGLGLQRYNYGLGLQLALPLLQAERVKPQIRQQEFKIRAGTELLNQANLQLNYNRASARASLESAVRLAQESPLALDAAHYAFEAMQSRYLAGLATLPEMLQSQTRLVQAETERRLAYLGAWNALLTQAEAFGNLNHFVNQIK